jgi:acyl carrier protein
MSQLTPDQLKYEIKQLIIDTLGIKDIKPEDVQNDVPLFSNDNVLGLDSIDGIEIIMAVQRKYEVRIDDQNLARFILESINTIADFVADLRAPPFAAAELVVREKINLMQSLESLERRLSRAGRTVPELRRERLLSLIHRLSDPRRRLSDHRLSLDGLFFRLSNSIRPGDVCFPLMPASPDSSDQYLHGSLLTAANRQTFILINDSWCDGKKSENLSGTQTWSFLYYQNG